MGDTYDDYPGKFHTFEPDDRDLFPASEGWIELKSPADYQAMLKKEKEVKDEYHTMDELYEYRMLYNAMAATALPSLSVKSWRHSDGELCFGGGWFVVYMDLPTGQVSNHYRAEYWDLFQIRAVKVAPEYDGHTPQVAAQRMHEFLKMEEWW